MTASAACTRIGAEVARHPRHVALVALCCGLLLAGRLEVAAGVAALRRAFAVTIRPRASPIVLLCMAGLVPAGALAGGARLAEIDDSRLLREAGRHVELVGHVIRREPVSHGVRRVRVEATAYRFGAGRPWTALEERVQLRSRGSALARVSIGEEVWASGSLARPQRSRGSFDYVAYLRRAGVRTVLHADRAAADRPPT